MDYIKKDTIFINLNSYDGTPFVDDKSNSYMNFPFHSVLVDADDIVDAKVSIINAQLPVSFYNVNANCNILNYVLNSVSKTMYVSVGNYNEITLAAQLTTQFLVDGYTFVISFNKITGKLTFGNSLYSFSFLSTSTIFTQLGFSKNTTYTSTGLSLISPYPMSMLGTRKIKICSEQIIVSNLDSLNTNTSNTLQFIPVNAPPFGMILFQNENGKHCSIRNNNIDSIDIKILDDNNNLVNFNGVHWSITLELTIFRNLLNNKNISSFGDITKSNNINDAKHLVESNFYDNDLQFLLYQNKIYLT